MQELWGAPQDAGLVGRGVGFEWPLLQRLRHVLPASLVRRQRHAAPRARYQADALRQHLEQRLALDGTQHMELGPRAPRLVDLLGHRERLPVQRPPAVSTHCWAADMTSLGTRMSVGRAEKVVS